MGYEISSQVSERKGCCMKIKISYRTADILDMICTAIFIFLAFWADWRIGIAFIVYELSRVCEKIKEALRVLEEIERFSKNNPDKNQEVL
jgi:hypothetical protein